MKEQLISFDTAKLAKEKGFNYQCNRFYFHDKELGFMLGGEINSNLQLKNTSAPTQSLLQKWLRDEKSLCVFALPSISGGWYSDMTRIHNVFYIGDPELRDKYPTYEEALEDGLFKALELIK